MIGSKHGQRVLWGWDTFRAGIKNGAQNMRNFSHHLNFRNTRLLSSESALGGVCVVSEQGT